MLVCTEYAAVATVMQYWTPTDQVNPAVWVAMCTLSGELQPQFKGWIGPQRLTKKQMVR